VSVDVGGDKMVFISLADIENVDRNIAFRISLSIYYRTRDTSTSGLAAAMLRFRCRTMSAGVGLEFIGLADIENIEITFRISFLSTIEREIQVLPVWRPPFCVSGLLRSRTMSAGVGHEFIGFGDLGNIGIAVGISFLSVLQPELSVLPIW
jgi:hypothetical protein